MKSVFDNCSTSSSGVDCIMKVAVYLFLPHLVNLSEMNEFTPLIFNSCSDYLKSQENRYLRREIRDPVWSYFIVQGSLVMSVLVRYLKREALVFLRKMRKYFSHRSVGRFQSFSATDVKTKLLMLTILAQSAAACGLGTAEANQPLKLVKIPFWLVKLCEHWKPRRKQKLISNFHNMKLCQSIQNLNHQRQQISYVIDWPKQELVLNL